LPPKYPTKAQPRFEMSVFNDNTFDDSSWLSQRFLIAGKPSTPSEVFINTIICHPPQPTKLKGTILLIHGFPETSYQFRHVITPLSQSGYLVIAPDYRGAGSSSKPRDGYDKITMAADLHTLVTEHIGIKDKVHVVGHDIGGMVAHAYAATFPESTASVAWGECPLPGTEGFAKAMREETHGGVWHFAFHWQADLPELLVQGRERIYIRSFYDRLAMQPLAITEKDTDHYAAMFARPGALRAGFDTYRAFHQDAEDNRGILREKGKCKVPCLTLNGDGSFLASIASEQAKEVYEDVTVSEVPRSGHWIAEENPAVFVVEVLKWISKHAQ